jgi:thiol-disulfide isomerase/thioredoxin
MFRRILVLTVIIIVVASVAVVRIAKLRGRGQRSTASRDVTKANVAVAVSDLQPDELIAAANAPAAPEFAKGDWINSDPLTLNKLRGHIVLVEFWTFGCYNCRNTLPSVKEWDARYRDRGLTIVGVHTPETTSEYSIDNVRREVPGLAIKYPVVTDNNYQTWKAYGVEAWPTILVVDKQGRIRWLHVGEGKYDETENVIRTLLAE